MKQASAVKLFIGQIPKEWTEAEVRSEFEPFGEIYKLNLIPDKANPGQHKSSAFLTYFENDAAESAQSELHNKKTLPGMSRAMQVKPAEGELLEENRKLFVGMLSKSLEENELHEMFSPFGTIEKLTILKDQNGSKGCAFITYQSRLQAQNAIKDMNGSQTMEGVRSAIVVKLADSEKDKLAKKNPAAAVGSMNGIGSAINTSNNNPAAPLSNDTAILAAQVAYYQQMFAQMGMPQVIANAPGSNQTLGQIVVGGSGGGASVVPLNSRGSGGLNSGLPYPYNTATAKPVVNEKQQEGPEDANLFVYHIPMSFSDSDLLETFNPFGNVVSAKVFIDMKTGESKGFGFVSYDNAASASNAISAMNGFALGSKKLKVQLKRKRDQAKPY